MHGLSLVQLESCGQLFGLCAEARQQALQRFRIVPDQSGNEQDLRQLQWLPHLHTRRSLDLAKHSAVLGREGNSLKALSGLMFRPRHDLSEVWMHLMYVQQLTGNPLQAKAYGPGISGALFGGGWWFWVDACAASHTQVPFVQYLPGIVATIALIMINAIRR